MTELKIFIVEDDEWYAEYIKQCLLLDQDVTIETFQTGSSCMKNLKDHPDVITVDYRLPDMTGQELLKAIKEICPDTEVIIISEQGKIETAIELLKQGAYDYIVKSPDIRDRLLNMVRNLKKQRLLHQKISNLEKEVERKYDFEKLIVGQSKPIRHIFSLIEKAAQTEISVIVTGETGTGKELVARAIHFNSARKKQPFITINMAAIPRELVESELFGHEKGAFTGAYISRKGKFEDADQGTLFLDEISEMDLTNQAKLLRALQEKEITRVGANKSIKVNCRIIVASNKNILQMVKENRFRDDLYYRLYGLNIPLPPLRERENDILVLAKHFISGYARENNQPEKILTREAQLKLLSYYFPGNIRELKSVIELGFIMSNANEIDAEHILFSNDETEPEMINKELSLDEHNRRIIKAYLNKYNGNVKKAAEKLDIGFSTIYRMMRKEKPAE